MIRLKLWPVVMSDDWLSMTADVACADMCYQGIPETEFPRTTRFDGDTILKRLDW
jgi:hypothetical protein